MSKDSITLCIVARNAESTVQSCIESAANIASQIVVIDCGSSDRTVALGRQKGAMVFRADFSSDKSSAYNLAKTHARGDWVFFLEAHEQLVTVDPKLIEQLVRDQSKCYQVAIQKNESNSASPVLEIRLFPRVSSIYFAGHENPSIEFSVQESQSYSICKTDLAIRSTAIATAELPTQSTTEGDWKSYFHLAVQHKLEGRLEESAEFFKQSSQLNSGNIRTWTNLGLVLTELEKFSEAEQALLQALAIESNSHEAHCNLGVLFLRKRELPIAEHHFRLALQNNPYSVGSHCNLAETLALMNRKAEAIQMYLRALEIMPTCALAKASLGLLYISLHQSENAEKCLLAARTDDPSMPQVHLFLGQLYCSLNRTREALSSLERFCALEENYHENYPRQKKQMIASVKQKCNELKKVIQNAA